MKAKKFKATEADGDTTDGVGGMNLQTRATVPGPETANQLAGSTTNKKCYRRFANLCSTYSGSLDTEEHVPAAMHVIISVVRFHHVSHYGNWQCTKHLQHRIA